MSNLDEQTTMRPVMNVVAGPNGSGKTFITSELLFHRWMDGCVYVNPDEIAQQKFGDWNSQEAILKAAKQAQSIREICLTQGKNFAFGIYRAKCVAISF